MNIVLCLPPLGTTLLLVVASCALVVLVLGNRIVNTLPTIQHLHLMQDHWSNLYIRPSAMFTDPLGYRKIGKFCQLRFEEVTDPINADAVVHDILDKRTGDIVSVVHYNPWYVDKVVNEINAYAAISLFLLIVGGAMAYAGLVAAHKATSIVNLGQEMIANHLIPIPVVSSILMGLSGLRLWIEIKKISSVLGGQTNG